MAKRQFEGTDHAQIYSAHRPDALLEIAEKGVSFLREKFDGSLEIAVDVGCGPGQSSVILAPFFHRVYGVDASEAQIQEALKHRVCSNIHYKVAEAENLPFDASSVQLVTAGGSLHWFEIETFLKEVRRILVPGGVFLVYTYHSLRPFFHCPLKKKEVDSLYEQIYEELNPYWPKEVYHSLNVYEKVQFPFKECKRIPDMRQLYTGTISNLIGYVKSQSAFQIMKKADISKADSFESRFANRLRDILDITDDQDSKTFKLYRDFYCIICRKEESEN